MFAVISTGGKQYKVRVGETIDVEKLAVDEGAQVQLDQVLLAANDSDVAYGRPMIDGAVVTARVVRQHRGPKLIVFHYKSKSRYRRRTGHRQSLTQLAIQSIAVPGWEVERYEPRRTAVAAETAPAAIETAPEATVAPEAQAWSAVTVPEEAVPAQGAAAPPGDVLPVVDPAAQITGADSAALDATPDAVGGEPPAGLLTERLPEPGAE